MAWSNFAPPEFSRVIIKGHAVVHRRAFLAQSTMCLDAMPFSFHLQALAFAGQEVHGVQGNRPSKAKCQEQTKWQDHWKWQTKDESHYLCELMEFGMMLQIGARLTLEEHGC